MSQAVYKEQPLTEKLSGLDQSVSPTINVQSIAFSMRGVLERNQILQRLPGKVAEMKRDGDVFHIHVSPDGNRFISVYGEGLILVTPE